MYAALTSFIMVLLSAYWYGYESEYDDTSVGTWLAQLALGISGVATLVFVTMAAVAAV